MSTSPSSAYWGQSWPRSPHGHNELDVDSFSDFSSELTSPDQDWEDEGADEFHEEEFLGILALAELARGSFASSSRAGDLEEYMAYLRDALTVAPPDGPARADVLDRLAHSLHMSVSGGYFASDDSLERLNESIHLHRLALYHLPVNNEVRAEYVTHLAIALRTRFAVANDVEDLHECIALHSQALVLRPSGHPDRISSLTSLANVHWTLFECTGTDSDLERAVFLDEEALRLLPHGHPDRHVTLLGLAADLGARYAKHASQDDLRRSTTLYQEALQLAATDRDRLRTTQCLASLLFMHYGATHDVTSLHEAIDVCTKALDEASDASAGDKLPILRVLADMNLTQHLDGSGEAHHLEGAVTYCARALQYLPEPCALTDKLDILMNLAYALVARFSHAKQQQDIDQAVSLCTQAVEMCPFEHPYCSRLLRALARGLAVRQEGSTSLDDRDMQKALELYAEAVKNPYSLTRERITYGLEWVQLLSRRDIQSRELLAAYKSVIGLFQHLAYFEDMSVEELTKLSRTLVDAVQCALRLDDIEQAIALVEQRQEILWCPRRLDSMIQPPLRQRLHKIARELYGTCHIEFIPTLLRNSRGHSLVNLDESAARRRNLVEEFHGLVQHLRRYPGLSNLLQPIEYVDLMKDWNRKPLVLLVVQPQCKAIICRGTELGGITTVSLPLTSEELKRLASEFHSLRQDPDEAKCIELCHKTWQSIVGPILESMGISTPDQDARPHVWWCPTGPFTFIPLHAAIRASTSQHSTCTSDYVVSSYIPSITAMRKPKPETRARLTILTTPVTPTTPSHYTQNFSRKDDTHVVQIPSPTGTEGLSFSYDYDYDAVPNGRRAPIIRLNGPLDSSIPKATAHRDSSNPLHFNGNELLTDLTDAATSQVAFAFLHSDGSSSATEENATVLPCEATHSGLALCSSGFRSVVSTVPGWHNMLDARDSAAVIDQICKDIGYDNATDLPPNVVPYALDKAIRDLRRSGVPVTRWIPFIHIGQ